MTRVKAGPFFCLQFRITAGLGSTILSLVLAGCAVSGPIGGPTSPGEALQNVALSGAVHGGQPPVTKSNIALFATSSAGYNGTLTPLATTQTDTSGNFNITTTIVCPTDTTSQTYLVSTGGNPGLTTGTDNSAIFLVAALGNCRNLSNFPYVVINEVTTVAAAYALSGFAPVGGAGMTEAAEEGGTMAGFTTSSTNTQGLTDGFANATNIVNVATGSANSTPSGGASGTVPAGTINALADILQDCVNSTLPTSTACNNLFGAATPPTGSGITKPANVFQAALDIAQYPGNNVGTLFGLISSQASFEPTVSAAPNDWTIGVVYTYAATVLKSGLGMGIDNYDNVYITGSTANTTSPNETDLIVVSPQGVLGSSTLMGTTSTANNIRWIAFDASNNAYMANGNTTTIYKFAPATPSNPANGGTLTPLSYSGINGNTNTYAVAVDQDGDVWTQTYKKSTCLNAPSGSNTAGCALMEFPVSSLTSPVDTFSTVQDLEPSTAADGGGARGVAFDVNTGNVWTTDIVSSNLSLFNVTPSATTAATASAAPSNVIVSSAADSNETLGDGSVSVAVDATHNAWVVVDGSGLANASPAPTIPPCLYKVTPALAVTSMPSGATTPCIAGGLSSPGYLAIDGSGNIFIANNGGNNQAGGLGTVGAVVEFSPTLNTYLSPNYGFSPSATYSGAGSGATATATLSGTGVASIAVGAGGTGYINPPGVTITSASGTGATATASVSGGVVVGINVTNAGTGYLTSPTVTIGTLFGSQLYEPAYVAVDRSGAMWALSSGSNGATSLANLVQILGVATPVNPVQAAGQYGVKP